MHNVIVDSNKYINKAGMFVRLRLKTKIFLLIILVVFLSLAIAGFLITEYVSKNIEGQISQLALDIAHTVAEIPDIRDSIGKKDGYLIINPIAEEIRKKTKAEFVVVMDMESIRYSHPVKERIGQKFVGGDEKEVFTGKAYVSSAIGTLGHSLRAFVPVFRNGWQVGAVSVGVLTDDIQLTISDVRRNILNTLFLGMSIGFIGAAVLARNVKKAMFGLEPVEIATLAGEKQAILASVREGIIAINKHGVITEMNGEARKLLELKQNAIGRKVTDVVPNTRLPEILATGKAEIDQDQLFYGNRVLTTRIPMIINGHIIGAVASFRDMTEVQRLAEELTGVKKYVEALRAQSHEFRNRTHTIAGLLQLHQYEEAIEFIMLTSEKDQGAIDFVMDKIKDPLICGLLLGKLAVAKEVGVILYLDEMSFLSHITGKPSSNQLITVIGNLIDNALDAISFLKDHKRTIRVLLLEDTDWVIIEVEDWGEGISQEAAPMIYEQGFSTKGEKNKGIGLTLVNNFVKEINGTIIWNNKNEGGVIFRITIPRGAWEK